MNIYKNRILSDLNGEVWVDIPEYENHYQISNLGRIKSVERLLIDSVGNYKLYKSKILKQHIGSSDYLQVRLRLNKKASTKSIHQLVAMGFLNHKPNKHLQVVDHINNIKTDNRLINLQIISQRENTSKDRGICASKFTGVSWNKVVNKWCASIRINSKVTHLGYFENEEEAGIAYKLRLNKITNTHAI